MHIIMAIIAGLVFGAGLTISGMVNPAKVLDFLDFAAIPTGKWDATLGVVFVSALAVMFVAFAIQRRQREPLFRVDFAVPTRSDITGKLILGSVLFGAGWGLVGLCPGPAITALFFWKQEVLIFVVAMIVGMSLNTLLRDREMKAKFTPRRKTAEAAE